MVRASTHKEKTRARILEEAAKAMRVHGCSGVSVVDLMKRAGLTHGGFYAHFASRDDLVAHAIDRMFEDSAALAAPYLQDASGPGLAAFIDAYLSERAMDRIEMACPVPGLAGEASRLPAAARERFETGIAKLRAAIGRSLANMGQANAESLASSVLSEMIGGMAIARALNDRDEARTLLEETRRGLKARLGLSGDRPVA